mmetsp:Transcript_7174/g.15011  ORF Transcript_7174/g.15011 Transcript_7174/m.15011 type:complete len:206 (+) Transcript_7174:1449-2066(+)
MTLRDCSKPRKVEWKQHALVARYKVPFLLSCLHRCLATSVPMAGPKIGDMLLPVGSVPPAASAASSAAWTVPIPVSVIDSLRARRTDSVPMPLPSLEARTITLDRRSGLLALLLSLSTPPVAACPTIRSTSSPSSSSSSPPSSSSASLPSCSSSATSFKSSSSSSSSTSLLGQALLLAVVAPSIVLVEDDVFCASRSITSSAPSA